MSTDSDIGVEPAVTSSFDYSAGDKTTTAGNGGIGDCEKPGEWIGPYRLGARLGEGGMGTVYLAEQEHPIRRRVALKLIKAGADSAALVARFEAERQAIAVMNHPNIAKLLDAGTTEGGSPFFVMELVGGFPFTRYCDEKALGLRERLALFVPLCQAIQHAHTKGIIHRDIKPSNVLVTEVDGRAVPKVIDFGIAKATDPLPAAHGMHTHAGMPIGTFEYMAPEQADGAGGVDTRADIYSLGVLLYEVLTGTTPHESASLRAAGFVGAVRLIRETDPPTPSGRLVASGPPAAVATARRVRPPARLPKLVRAELDWIVMRCLEKDPARRYQSADAVAEDIGHYLADRPVGACPPSFAYRARKFARKNRGLLAAAAALLVALVGGAVVSTWQAVQANRAKEAVRDGMTRQVAERIEGNLGRFAAVGDALAATVVRRGDWADARIGDWMAEMLEREPQIFGLCVAYEDDFFPEKGKNYHLYKCREHKHSEVVIWKPLTYKCVDEAWYKGAKAAGRAIWTKPFVDRGGGDIPMVTCAVPLYSGPDPVRVFVGVAVADISLTYFTRLRGWLSKLDFGSRNYGFVVTRDGTVISHPDPAFDFGERADARIDSPHRFPEFADLGPGGRFRAADPSTGKPTTFLYSRIQLDRHARNFDLDWWTFLVAIED